MPENTTVLNPSTLLAAKRTTLRATLDLRRGLDRGELYWVLTRRINRLKDEISNLKSNRR